MSYGTSGAAAVDGVATTMRVVTTRPQLLRLSGEFDIAAVAAVRRRLGGVEGDVDLDCSGLTFIDVSALRLLVAVHEACEGRGAKLVIVNPSRCVMRLLELTGLDAVLTVRRVSSTW